MSKSSPDSAIFMEDTEADVKRKVNKAYAPRGILEGNPCIDYISTIIFPKYGEMKIERAEEYGGNITYKSFEKLCEDYVAEKL